MFEKNYYTLRGVADELNIGESTIQYWQDQYHTWIPCKDNEKEKWYPRQAIGILRFIMESANSGMPEEDIEKELSIRYPMVKEFHRQEIPRGGIESGMQVMHGDSVSGVLKGLLEGLSRQQMRIADAQERRVAAEERKASAMEKRAEAQKLMADALNNVAVALQQVQLPGSGKGPGSILNNGRSIPSEDPTEPIADDPGPDASDEEVWDTEMQERVVRSLLDDVLEDNISSGVSDPDDLSELLEDSEEKLSDTSDTSDTPDTSDTDDLSELLTGLSEESEPETDDLSELIEGLEEKTGSDTDDLSDLLASSSEETESELDDLSELLEGSPDDLSESPEDSEEKSAPAADDLTEPVEGPPEDADVQLNEASDAINATAAVAAEQPAPIPGDYKSKIIALIIQLKEKKEMGVEEVTEYMNTKGYKTISGKGSWDSRTIAQIFEHMKTIRSEDES